MINFIDVDFNNSKFAHAEIIILVVIGVLNHDRG